MGSKARERCLSRPTASEQQHSSTQKEWSGRRDCIRLTPVRRTLRVLQRRLLLGLPKASVRTNNTGSHLGNAPIPHCGFGAGEGIRTLDINLGKVALYQLSYARID